MRKSKYLGMTNGDWTCTHVGVERVQPAFKEKRDYLGRRVRNKYPGHQSYYYIFERLTSDQKAMKMIRLNAQQVRRVRDGWFTVEDIADKKAAKRSQIFKEKVSYSFCD
jgi:N6-adenosine-specific RNA methylase IME4